MRWQHTPGLTHALCACPREREQGARGAREANARIAQTNSPDPLSPHRKSSCNGPTASRASTCTRRSHGEWEREERERKGGGLGVPTRPLTTHPPPPTLHRLLTNLYNGTVSIWSTEDGSLVRSFEASDLPVRAATFVARKQWVVTGADDMHVRAHNYNTLAKEAAFEAHGDYIRALAVHPSAPLLLSAGDDMVIKLWDWDRAWACAAIFEGHTHYVMAVAFNPRDANTFASASLDRTVKVWSLANPTPAYTLEGHEKGVNAVSYCRSGDRPYLVSGGDDRTARVWDYQTKACVHVLGGHAHNVSAAAFHPDLPLLITGSEDGAIRLWHAATYRLEASLSYGLERVWAVAARPGSTAIAAGCDDGVVYLTAGRDDPAASMDATGKLVWARGADVCGASVRALGEEALAGAEDGDRLPLAAKDVGACDCYPSTLTHSPNGRFVAAVGDGEYVIYTALAWRSKAYGPGLDVAWRDDSAGYGVRTSPTAVTLFHQFKEAGTLRLPYACDGVHGGPLLAARGADCVVFYDWESGLPAARVDVGAAASVSWSESRSLVAIVTDAATYILAYDPDAAAAASEAAADGVEESEESPDVFELTHEITDAVASSAWVGDCFVFASRAARLAYAVGGDVAPLAPLDGPQTVVGALASAGRAFTIDRDGGVASYRLPLAVIEYKTAVLAGDVDAAAALLSSLPTSARDGVARFLEARGELDAAAAVAVDDTYRFELASSRGDLAGAADIAATLGGATTWRALAEAALAAGDLPLAARAARAAGDVATELLIATARGDAPALADVSARAASAGRTATAFAAALAAGDAAACVDVLVGAGRAPEAALFARSHAPSALPRALAAWKEALASVNPRAADALADPEAYPNLFPGWGDAVAAEGKKGGGGRPPSSNGHGAAAAPPPPAAAAPPPPAAAALKPAAPKSASPAAAALKPAAPKSASPAAAAPPPPRAAGRAKKRVPPQNRVAAARPRSGAAAAGRSRTSAAPPAGCCGLAPASRRGAAPAARSRAAAPARSRAAAPDRSRADTCPPG